MIKEILSYRVILNITVACIVVFVTSCAEQPRGLQSVQQRQTIDFNFDWRFSLAAQSQAHLVDFNDNGWRKIRLPHDWSIEAEYSQKDRAGATGYLPGGKGWYRKTFNTPVKNGKTQILFDGIYNHSKVWINGQLLGERPYGYTPFHFDLTPYLNPYGQPNTISIFVDRSRYVDSRWYTGSGIYRNVKLITTNAIHIPIWGSTVTTPSVSKDKASMSIHTEINNEGSGSEELFVIQELRNQAQEIVAQTRSKLNAPANNTSAIEQTFSIEQPELWSPDTPILYTLITTVMVDKHIVDSIQQKIGLRHFENNPKTGFYLNGKPLKIKGVNLHHDAGLVGAAVPKGVWKRRLQTLKSAGVNAIRTAHNPASNEFLDLCDEMGFLVQEEAFDEWDNPKDKRKNFNQQSAPDYITESYSLNFSKWAKQDIQAMVKRGRNHPSIFQWGIGNEIEWTYPRYTAATGYWDKKSQEKHNYYWETPPYTQQQIANRFKDTKVAGAELCKTANKLATWVKEVDSSRPVTANLVTPTVSHSSGYTDALDVIGYSYRQAIYDIGHEQYPNKMILGTENWVQWHEWQAVLNRPYVAGIFVWTGIDYLGESNGRWPKKASGSGMLDLAGFTKTSFHMMKSIWSSEPHIHMATQQLNQSIYKLDGNNVIEKQKGEWKHRKWGWHSLNKHWNYSDNESTIVEVYTNQDAIELVLNNRSLGVQYLKDNPDRILKWHVPFERGVISARSVNHTAKTLHTSIETSGLPSEISLTTDKVVAKADGYDVIHVVAQLLDNKGLPVYHIDREIQFSLNGNITSLGVDNGSNSNIQKHKSLKLTTDKGRALLILQTTKQTGNVTVLAKSQSSLIKSQPIKIKTISNY